MRTIDHYKYWSERNKRDFLWHREKISLKLLKKLKTCTKIIDLGCGDGHFSEEMLQLPNLTVYGSDLSISELKKARKKGVKSSIVNFEYSFPFKNNKLDVVYAAELLEHLYNPDQFIQECSRILKNKGYLLLTTPNLAAWYNRILLFLGMQPIFIETSVKNSKIGSSILKKFKKDSHPVGHVRIFTYDAVKDLLNTYGFKILETKGAIFDSGLPRFMQKIDKLFAIIPKLSSHLVILAQKNEKPVSFN